MKHITYLIFLLLTSSAFSQDLSSISKNDTIFLVLPQNSTFKEVKLKFSNFRLSYIGSTQYGINQYSFYDEFGSRRISLNTQDDSPSTYVVKRNITVETQNFIKNHKNNILTLQSIEKYGYTKLFYETLKIQNRKLYKWYVINEADLKNKTIILRQADPYSFE